MEPRFEPVGIAQAGELAPRIDQGDLDGVLGAARVAENAKGDAEAAITDEPGERRERPVVAVACLLDHRPQHPSSLQSFESVRVVAARCIP